MGQGGGGSRTQLVIRLNFFSQPVTEEMAFGGLRTNHFSTEEKVWKQKRKKTRRIAKNAAGAIGVSATAAAEVAEVYVVLCFFKKQIAKGS